MYPLIIKFSNKCRLKTRHQYPIPNAQYQIKTGMLKITKQEK